MARGTSAHPLTPDRHLLPCSPLAFTPWEEKEGGGWERRSRWGRKGKGKGRGEEEGEQLLRGSERPEVGKGAQEITNALGC